MANIAVANKIATTFPKISLLRRHPAPKALVLKNMVFLIKF